MTKELLTDLYCVQEKSTGEIAKQFDVSRGIVLRIMTNFGIERRVCTEGRRSSPFVKNLEEKLGETIDSYLQREYFEKKRAKRSLMQELGISDRAISIYLKRFDIKMRSPQEASNVTFDLENMPTDLTENEKQVLYGSLLGDGALTVKEGYSKNATFQEGHCLEQRPYLEWKAEQLKRFKPVVRDLNLTPSKITGKTYRKCQLYTSPAPILNELYKKFYGEKKIVTRELLDELTPLGLAIWYMDDGSYIHTKNSYNSVLYTNCFSHEEHLIMQDWFEEKWNIDVRIIEQQKKYFFLRFPVSETIKFQSIIKQHIHSCMMYKIGV